MLTDSFLVQNEILDVYNRSMVPAEEREESFAPVLIAFLDPLVQACRQSSEGLGLSDTAVFMLNNIVEMQVCHRPFDRAPITAPQSMPLLCLCLPRAC